MKKINVCLFFIFNFNVLYAADPSTPPDGNLFFKKTFIFAKAKQETYYNTSFVNKYNIKIENNRIYSDLNRIMFNISSELDLTKDFDPVITKEGYTVVLTGNSNRYAHGILGDKNEATGFVVLKNGKIISSYKLEGSRVFETLRPLAADITADNPGQEIILTSSDSKSGARIDVFSINGRLLGSSPSIGQGYRWMHLLAVAPFGPEKQMEVALVRTPHIGGILEFYRWDEKSLFKTASLSGISTHTIGSNNLNKAIAADFTGDNGAELLVPSDDFRSLKIVKRVNAGIRILQTIQLPGRLNTNILLLNNGNGASIWIGIDNGSFIKYSY
jgi:hypothetical protein